MLGLRRRPKEIDLIINLPANLEATIQQVVEAHRTIEDAQIRSLAVDDIDSVLFEAEMIVLANLRARVSTVTRSLDMLQQQRSTQLELGDNSLAEDTGDNIAKTEADLQDLTERMATAVAKIKEHISRRAK